ncbi:MAG: MmgE/PrpD family protein [Dehalococcoidia bacterium]
MSTTSQVARFILDTDFKSLNPDVIHAGKKAFINFLAVSIYSSTDPSLKILLDLFNENTNKQLASIVGTNIKSNLDNAALANGYLGHLEDFDDTHFPTIIHPSSPTFPSALALAENLGKTGKEFLLASILGIEICCRVGVAMHPSHYDQGWHITGTTGVFGSAVASGILLDLNETQLKNCFGIAGTQAAGVREVFGTMSKPFHAGRSAQSGLLAANLASKGFTSATNIFEGRRGFFDVLAPDYDLSILTGNFGSQWEILQNGLKPYACGVVNHPLIDAMIKFKNENVFNIDDIKSIKAYVHHLVPELVGHKQHPTIGLEGKFSFHHSMAVGLLYGRATPLEYTDIMVKDTIVEKMRNIIQCEIREDFSEEQAIVEVIYTDNTSVVVEIENCSGSPENPLTDNQLNDKFNILVQGVLGEKRTEQLLSILWNLEDVDNIASVLPMMNS